MEHVLTIQQVLDNLLEDILMEVDQVKQTGKASQTVPLLIGEYGIGKTQMMSQIAGDLLKDIFEGRLLTLRISEMPEGEIGGLPDINSQVSVYRKPQWLTLYSPEDWVLVFWDEINRGQERDSTQAMLHKILSEHQVHHEQISPRWIFVAACNPDNGDYQVSNLLADKSMLTRFRRYHVTTSVEDWLLWAKEHEIHSVVREYIAGNPDALTKGDNCPRTWDEFSKALTWLVKRKRPELIVSKATSLLEPDTALDFWRFWQSTAKVTVQDIYDGKNVSKVSKDVLVEATQALIHEDTEVVLKNIGNVLSFLKSIPPEITHMYLMGIRQKKGDDWLEIYAEVAEDTALVNIVETLEKNTQSKEGNKK